MNKIFFLGYFLLVSFSNFAQKCNGIVLDTLHGKWVTVRTGAISEDSKIDVLKEKQNMEGVNELVRKNFNWVPVGGDIGYGVFWVTDDHRPLPLIKIGNPYYTRFEFKQFNCDNGKIVHSEVADYVTTYFNDLPFEFDQTFFTTDPKSTSLDVDPRTDVYTNLHWLPEVKDGYFDYIQDNIDGTGKNATGYVYRFRTIIKPGKLPYMLMCKKEYYEKWKIKHKISIEILESTKAKMIKELQGNPYLNEGVKAQEIYIALYQNYINKIDEILKNKSTEELSTPAFEGEQEGKYFESVEASVYKAYIVKPNYDYYNYHLNSKSSPQVITVSLRYGTGKNEQGNRIYADSGFYNALEDMKFFDFMVDKLRPLIVQ